MAVESNKPVVRPRPLVLILTAVIVGILGAPFVPLAPLLCFATAMFTLLGALFVIPPSVRILLFLVSFALMGIGRMREVSQPSSDDVSRYTNAPSVWVSGNIASLVESNATGGYTFNLAVTSVNDSHVIRQASGTLHITLRKGPMPEVGAGMRLRGRIELLQTATNPGAFDYADYSARHGMFCRMTVRSSNDAQTLQKPAPSLLQIAQTVRQWVQTQTAKHLSADDAALLDGLLLSVRTQLPITLDDAFQRTGTVHILSVSGLHMTAFAGVLVFLFRYWLLPRPLANLMSIALIWLFALAAGASAAPVRAAIMATVFLAAPLLRRTAEPLHALTFAALILLFADPGSLFDAGFQLSFASVGGLMLFMGPLSERFLPMEQGQSRLKRFSQHVLQLLLAGFVAEAVTAPLVAYHFNLWSLVAPFANVLITVWSEWLLLTALAIVLLSPVIYWIMPVLGSIIWLPMTWGLWILRFLVRAFAVLPFAAQSVPSPPTWVVIAYYALLGGIAFYVRHHLRQTLAPPVAPMSSGAVLPADKPPATPSRHLS